MPADQASGLEKDALTAAGIGRLLEEAVSQARTLAAEHALLRRCWNDRAELRKRLMELESLQVAVAASCLIGILQIVMDGPW